MKIMVAPKLCFEGTRLGATRVTNRLVAKLNENDAEGVEAMSCCEMERVRPGRRKCSESEDNRKVEGVTCSSFRCGKITAKWC